MLGLIIFLLGSLGFVVRSRQALLNPRSYGFPRFFAFEGILGLVVLNGRYWFNLPFSLQQLISWVLLLISLFLAIHGFSLLHRLGKPEQAIPDASRLTFEKTTRLVVAGAYRYIRHPLYASLMCFGWGAFLKHISLLPILLVILVTMALYTTAVLEEQENLRNFGDEYMEYMRHTKRFIPCLF